MRACIRRKVANVNIAMPRGKWVWLHKIDRVTTVVIIRCNHRHLSNIAFIMLLTKRPTKKKTGPTFTFFSSLCVNKMLELAKVELHVRFWVGGQDYKTSLVETRYMSSCERRKCKFITFFLYYCNFI